MKVRLAIAIFAALIFMAMSEPSFAHHGAASFDTSHRLTLKGKVVEWFWANPHCFLRFDAKDDKGETVHWAVETQSGTNLLPVGYSKQTFKPGDDVTVTFEPVRNGRPLGRMVSVLLPDGKKLTMDGVPGAPQSQP
jgi:hypothetical protein